MNWIKNLEKTNPENLRERLSQFLFLAIMTIMSVIFIVIISCYFFLFLFILDWIYWIISGKTVLWKVLFN